MVRTSVAVPASLDSVSSDTMNTLMA